MSPTRPASSLVRSLGPALRYAWASPATLVGLIISAIAICRGATVRSVDGVLEVACAPIHQATSFHPIWFPFVAITFGHLVIGIDRLALSRARCHEQIHVRQYERWGALFFPLYLASSLIQLVRGRDPYLDNCFELEARACDGIGRLE
jgi:hypothetical protein